MNVRQLLVGTVLVSSFGVITACAQPKIATDTIPAVECVYRLMKSDPAIQTVNVYAVDKFRSAIEYSFRYKDGEHTADLVFSGWGHGRSRFYMSATRESPQTSSREYEILSNLNLPYKCPAVPAFDNAEPTPKPRDDWQRVTWPSQSP